MKLESIWHDHRKSGVKEGFVMSDPRKNHCHVNVLGHYTGYGQLFGMYKQKKADQYDYEGIWKREF